MLAETPVPAWEIGSVEEGFKKADLIVDETVVHQSTGHQAMEPRSAMAYWQNGKLYLHGSTQSVARTRATVAQWVGFKPEEEDQGRPHQRVHRWRLRRKDSWRALDGDSRAAFEEGRRPARADAHFARRRKLHRPRTAWIHLRARIGFRKDGRITAMDLCAIADCGPYANQGDARHARVDRDVALQPGNDPVPRHQRTDEHAAARRAARAGRRAGFGDARAAHQQGCAAARRGSGRDSQDQRASHGLRVRPLRRRCCRGARPRPPQRRRAGAPADRPLLHNHNRGAGTSDGPWADCRWSASDQQPVAAAAPPIAAPRVLYELPFARSARYGREAVQLGRAQSNATASATGQR